MDRELEPELMTTPTGCLAATPRGASLHVGVFGANADEARERYAEALQAWERLATLSDENAVETATA